MAGVGSEAFIETHAALIWCHAALAEVTFVAAWALHQKFQPYTFDFQNTLDARLYLASGLVVALACLNTFLPESSRVVLEPLLLAVLRAGCRRA